MTAHVSSHRAVVDDGTFFYPSERDFTSFMRLLFVDVVFFSFFKASQKHKISVTEMWYTGTALQELAFSRDPTA